MGNAYYAYVHLENYQAWVELFGLIEEEPIFQKRILSIVSGAILPLVALGFIKSLVDYIKPSDTELLEVVVNDQITDAVTVEAPIIEETDDIVEKIRKENVEKYIENLEDGVTEENIQESVEEVTEIIEDDEKKN
jgi:hypothetical protein